MSEPLLALVYDFDGSLVYKRSKLDPRNATKYPMEFRPASADYLKLPETNPRVKSLGVLTMRALRWARVIPSFRGVSTRATIRNTVIGEHIEPSDVTYAGSDANKAKILIEWAQVGDGRVAIYDDKPYKVGAELLKLANSSETQPFGYVGIIAAEADDTKHESVQRFMETANKYKEETIAAYAGPNDIGITTKNGLIQVTATPNAYSAVDHLLGFYG